jgi:hypothetical protein
MGQWYKISKKTKVTVKHKANTSLKRTEGGGGKGEGG